MSGKIADDLDDERVVFGWAAAMNIDGGEQGWAKARTTGPCGGMQPGED